MAWLDLALRSTYADHASPEGRRGTKWHRVAKFCAIFEHLYTRQRGLLSLRAVGASRTVSCKVVPLATALAVIPLASGLGTVVPVLDDVDGAAPGTPHAVGPAHRPDRLEALGIVDQGVNVDYQRASRADRAIRR